MDNVSVQSFELGESFTETDARPSSARKRRSEGKRITINSPYGTPKQQPNAREVWMKSMQNGQGFNTTKSSYSLADTTHLNNQTKPVVKTRPVNKANHLDKEQMYDEIQDLRQIISAYSKEKDLLVTKINRLQKELMKKDKIIDDAFNPAKATDSYRVVGDSKKAETSAMVNSLKQKCHRLECMLREREEQISNIKNDQKSTRLQEQDIMIETYYEEIKRLNVIIEQKQFQNVPVRTSTPILDRTQNTLHLEAKMKQLEEDNAALCKSITETTLQPPATETGVIAEYSVLSRPQLEQEHQKLQKKLEMSEDEKDELNKKLLLHETEFRNVAAGQRKQSETLAKLRDDRKLYQEKLHQSQSELNGQKLVLKRLNKQVRGLEEENEELKETRRVETLDLPKRNNVQDRFAGLVLSMLQKDLKDREKAVEKKESKLEEPNIGPKVMKTYVAKNDSAEEPLRKANKLKEEAAACTIQKQWKRHKTSKELSSKRDTSAKCIQNNYRKHRLHKSVCTLQRVLRAHSARSLTVEKEHEVAVSSVQRALRGYSVRSQAINELKSQPPPRHASSTNTEQLIGGKVLEEVEVDQRRISDLSLPPTSYKEVKEMDNDSSDSNHVSIKEEEEKTHTAKQQLDVDSEDEGLVLGSSFKNKEKSLFSELGVQMLDSDSDEDLIMM